MQVTFIHGGSDKKL